MVHKSRFSVAFGAFLLSVLSSGTMAHGVVFNDNFSTNPFNNKWCERVHHAHWDVANLLLSGANGTSCSPTANSCVSAGCTQSQCVTDGSFGECSSSNFGGFLAITVASRAGNDRTASAHFAMQSAFTGPPVDPDDSNEHAAVFPAVHPNCHTGVQGIVASNFPSPGQYVQIVVGSEIKAGYPECNAMAAFGNKYLVSLATSTLPRYKLITHAFVQTGNLKAQADLIDNVSGATLASSSATLIPKPAWYSTSVRRYGLGSVRYSGVIPWDNFESNSF